MTDPTLDLKEVVIVLVGNQKKSHVTMDVTLKDLREEDFPEIDFHDVPNPMYRVEGFVVPL